MRGSFFVRRPVFGVDLKAQTGIVKKNKKKYGFGSLKYEIKLLNV